MERQLHSSPRNSQQQAKDDAKTSADARSRTGPAEEQAQKEASGSEKTAEQDAESAKDEERKNKGKGKDGQKEKSEGEDMPPPPPHGDKTPWQVFRETLNTGFEQSKEWKEGTKSIVSSAHQFTESESVRRAREAYASTSGAVSSTAATVVKTTAGAIGKGAAWTWETPVMKGVRKGANITGEVLDKATKPLRETETFKNVKDVIDDGSSKYGGWLEKEERRKQRELRQKMHGGPQEAIKEDPE